MTAPEPRAPKTAAGPWARFVARHLHDYPPAALLIWCAIAAAGGAAGAAAMLQLPGLDMAQAAAVVFGLCCVALAAFFPVRIPRSTHTVLVADVFIFSMLATLGPAAAVLAAGLEGAIGGLRSSRRRSTHISAPAANMAAMAVCSGVYSLLQQALVRLGLAPDVAALAALCATAPLPVIGTTGSLMAMIAAKQGRRLALPDWFDAASWILAVGLGAAFVAGVVNLNAQRFGPAVFVVATLMVLALVLLLRVAVQRSEREHAAQQALVDEAQREAERSQQRFSAAFTHAAIGMAIVRPGGETVQVNHALCALLGRTEADLLGSPFESLLHAGDGPLFRRQAAAALSQTEQAFSMELRCVGADGQDRWVAVHCGRYAGGEHGDAQGGLIYQLHDITSRRLAESRLHHIAFHDGLTDLANRTCFHERLDLAVERTRLNATERFAVMFLDLDRFKIVNDSLGHIAGNELLREVAQRLRACVRPSDLVARLGGDEFAVLLEDLHDPEVGMRLAQRVLDTLCKPVAINGTEVQPGASVGITFSDLGYRTADEVLRDADLAMYEAKAAGRGRVALFDSTMHERVAEKLALEADLRHAIGEGQLTVHFQPLYWLEPYRLYGFEALARWVHPVRGPVSPEVFIALAEETGHIEALTDWVIDHAVSQLAAWQRLSPAAASLGMHVNISGRDLGRPDLAAYVEQVLARHALPPQNLTLEITETTLMGRLELALQTMGQLRKGGVRFSIDDFGTGYSSLAYLGTLPIDSLKIDRGFVMGLHEQPQNIEIVRAVQHLGQSLGRKVIAEGIETAEQLATLRRLGVPIGQGYLLSRPLAAAQVLDLLAISVTA